MSKELTYFKPEQVSEFSNAHRKLPGQYAMFDIDLMYGEWLEITENKAKKEAATFIEYRCLKFDNDGNKFNFDRIKHIAIFELKYKLSDTLKEKINKMNVGSSEWAIFMTAKILNCRFFFVCANSGKSPFKFIEIDIKTNKRLPTLELNYDYKVDNSDIIKMFWNDKLKIK